jgi:hypothetical protein
VASRSYRYVGPEHVRAAAASSPPGIEIRSRADLEGWLDAHAADRDGAVIPATFVVSLEGALRLASRRSEHVACAGGSPVLGAGEMFFRRRPTPRVIEVSNLSTGYCPEPASWVAVCAALDRAGVEHPGRFTSELVFRRCPACGERNLVKELVFVCAICSADLPAEWNFD